MPVRIPLEAVANQSLSVQLDDQSYDITLKETQGVMSVTILINDVVVVSGSRFFADTPLIPYEYLEGAGGNFIMTTELDNIPIFSSLGITQFLFYLTVEDIASARS